jgi:L-seryl-tRNA(Ser) seleniumtransferase
MRAGQKDLYRSLPAVDELLKEPELKALAVEHGHAPLADAARTVLAGLRQEIRAKRLDFAGLEPALSGLSEAIRRQLGKNLAYSLRPLINATGVVLHTNLGRAPLSQAALEHIRATAGSYSNLEYDLESGERGRRDVHVERFFRKLLVDARPALSRSEPGSGLLTIVVNNNAAAVLLALNTLAEAGEVIVSRGELVEIGGSFRIPEVMAKSGAILREVGTTNRTRLADYEAAISERTRLLLRVHRSNFEISGFTEQPALPELVGLGRRHQLPVMEDLGSGALVDLASAGLAEPGVLDSLRAGADLVTYSGDKLLGGPQAGLISGREDLVKKMRRNSLFRALRVDKLTYAALESTLLAYVKRDYQALPALRMIQTSKAEITRRAEAVISGIRSSRLKAELVDGESIVGGGSAPGSVLATKLIVLGSTELSPNRLAARLRQATPAVIARVEETRVVLDLRTVFPEQDGVLRELLLGIAGSGRVLPPPTT